MCGALFYDAWRACIYTYRTHAIVSFTQSQLLTYKTVADLLAASAVDDDVVLDVC